MKLPKSTPHYSFQLHCILESRPMLITEKKLDELAYLLHANNQRADYERMVNPAKVEERKSVFARKEKTQPMNLISIVILCNYITE